MTAPSGGRGKVRVLVTGPAARPPSPPCSRWPPTRPWNCSPRTWTAGPRAFTWSRRAGRTLVPAGAAAGFAGAVLSRCTELGADVLLPTVDAELRPLARARGAFAAAGVALLMAPDTALDVTLDKLRLAECCSGTVRVPRTEAFGPAVNPASWEYPVIVKPRTGSGSRGIVTVASAADLAAMDRSPSLIVQDYLPGEEYSIDVGRRHGRARHRGSAPHPGPGGLRGLRRRPHGARPRAGAVRAGRREGHRADGVCNVQARRDRLGRPALLEVNPRLPGTLGLTIAAGVDMPRIAFDALLGLAVPAGSEFRELADVRYLENVFVDPAEMRTALGGWPRP